MEKHKKRIEALYSYHLEVAEHYVRPIRTSISYNILNGKHNFQRIERINQHAFTVAFHGDAVRIT